MGIEIVIYTAGLYRNNCWLYAYINAFQCKWHWSLAQAPFRLSEYTICPQPGSGMHLINHSRSHLNTTMLAILIRQVNRQVSWLACWYMTPPPTRGTLDKFGCLYTFDMTTWLENWMILCSYLITCLNDSYHLLWLDAWMIPIIYLIICLNDSYRLSD